MARSLLRQLEQIRRSAAYTDTVSDVNNSAVAEPTVSGSLQEDLNVIRTLMKDMKGTGDWFTTMPTYTDPLNTAADRTADFDQIAGETLDANTIILAVADYGALDAGFTVSGTSTGILRTITTAYALASGNMTGLPIFLSTTNSGSYYDEGGNDNVCRVDIIDQDNNEMQDGSGDVIYGKFYDGADDVGGTDGAGTGQDVYIKFFADGVETDLSTVDPAPTAVKFVYPQRKTLSGMEEWEWLRTDFISSWEGDVELVEDISNLWSYTGASDNVTDPTWTQEGNYYMLSASPNDLTTAIDTINTQVGDRNYSSTGYLTDDDTITDSLNDLDAQVKINADGIAASSGDKFVESLSAQADINTVHALPAAVVSAGGYTPDATAGSEGKNMDIYVDGQLLAADTGAAGVNADRDYGETTTSGITFRFNVQEGRNVTYVIRQ
jgi:hypothetical protein